MLSGPALLAVLLLAVLLSVGLNGEVVIEKASLQPLRGVDQFIGLLFLLTILGTIVGSLLYSIPPVLTFLTGLSLMFLIARFFN
jgi:hypothetical protein